MRSRRGFAAPAVGRIAALNAAALTIGAALALSLLGVYAIDLGLRDDPTAPLVGDSGLRGASALKQLLFVCFGMVAAGVAAAPHYRLIGYLAWPLMGAAVLLLVFLLIPMVPASIVAPRNGARAWINLGPVDFQPAEVAKIAFVLVVARYLRFRTQHRRFAGLLGPGLIAFIPVGLITLQPDLGTALLFIPALFAMLLAGGARLRHLAIVVMLAVMAAPAAYTMLRPYQKQRVIALVHQVQGNRAGAFDINYQSFTAQTLAGSGRLTGSGDDHARALIRESSLPERHNDMVLAVIMARFGLAGGLGLLGLYLAWMGGALLTAARCKDPFGRLVAVGLSAFVAAQAVVNIGMNVGLLPIVGITLPLVSYGGSSLLAVWLMTGLIVNIALRRPVPPYRPSFEYPLDDEE